MLRYALRRVLWSIPTLLATSFVLFLVTTLAPEPAPPRNPSDTTAADAFEQARRARFLDLPSFFNPAPRDVRSRARQALADVASGGARHEAAERELGRLGGAALPYVLPELEALPPDARRRVAVALARVARRMEIADGRDLTEPDVAALFWARFWDDRALDFTRAAAARAVARLVEYGGDSRERDLRVLDTFALQPLVRAMRTTDDPTVLARLTRLARHAAERGKVVEPDSDSEYARRTVADWSEWWFVYGTDFAKLNGVDGIVSVVTDTRFGKWLRRVASGELGVSAVDGESIATKLRDRAPLTLLVCALAMLVSGSIAVPVGAFAAWRRGRAFDVVSSAIFFVMYATPTFAVAELLRRATAALPIGGARIGWAVAALAAGSLATLARWQRSAMLDVIHQDYIRTARAKGVPPWRVLVCHALRNALLPSVTVAGLSLPALLSGAFVVEEVFDLPGIGRETIRAIESHDSAWLMAVLFGAAIAVTLGLVASDLAYGALDPRVREALGRRRGGLAP
jgi:ABC-type dipeptide/oligopeptide/nickel transport system permease component